MPPRGAETVLPACVWAEMLETLPLGRVVGVFGILRVLSELEDL